MESIINYVHGKLKKLGADRLMDNAPVKYLKGIGAAVTGLMTNFLEKIKKTGADGMVQLKFVAVLVLLVFLLGFIHCCCRGTAGKTMKAPGRKSTRISRNKFESNPISYFRDLRGKKKE